MQQTKLINGDASALHRKGTLQITGILCILWHEGQKEDPAAFSPGRLANCTNVITLNVTITWWPNATQLPKAQESPKGQYHLLRRGTSVYLHPQGNSEERQGMKNDLNKEMC